MVFSHLEADAENRRCDEAKQSVKLKKADFAQKYFYIFGLNLKYCEGIKMYKNSLNATQLIEQAGMKIVTENVGM